MQKLPVYLYTNLFEVLLDLDNNTGIHQIMYQNPLTIQKGVRNTIQLQFKNSDQKRLNISTQTFVMNVFDPIDDTLLLTKPVTILDTASTTTNALKGIGQVTFSEADTLYTEPKNYRFSVVKLEEDGSYSPTYANTYYGVSGTMEIKNDVLPNLKPSVTITDFQRNFNSSTLLWEYSTGNLRADPEFQSNGAVHTVAFFMTNFKGQVLVEGTLENSPTYYAYYAKLATKNYDGYSGGAYVTFTGLFTYIRVRYIPTANPTTGHNNDTTYAGTFDKVQHRS
jgi:hypothetical protein